MFFEPVEPEVNSEVSSEVNSEVSPVKQVVVEANDASVETELVETAPSGDKSETTNEVVGTIESEDSPTNDTLGDSLTSVEPVDLPISESDSVLEQQPVEVPEIPSAEATPAAEIRENDFNDYITKATNAKNVATNAYKLNDYGTAKINYMTALETLQFVQGDLNNKQKSTLFEQTVACNNNVALCCMATEDYQNCIAFATNSLLLIRSLEKNIPTSLIWDCLVENGVTLEQLQRQWKRKALYYIGKAHLKRKNFKEAVTHLEEAYNLIAEYAKFAKNAGELKVLLTDAKARLSKESQREKATWAKAFKKGKTEVESIYHDPRDTPTSSAPTTPIRSTTPLDPNNLKFDLSDLKAKAKDGKKKKKDLETSTALTTGPSFFSASSLLLISLFAAITGGGFYWFSKYRRR